MCIFALGGNAEDSASSMKSILLPTTSNDFSGMIYSLLQQQSSFVASQQGASVSHHFCKNACQVSAYIIWDLQALSEPMDDL